MLRLGVQEADPSPQQREAIRTRLADIDSVLAWIGRRTHAGVESDWDFFAL
jgi:hypothetical protein